MSFPRCCLAPCLGALLSCGRLGYEETTRPPFVDAGLDAGSFEVPASGPDGAGDVGDDSGGISTLCGSKALAGGLLCETFETPASVVDPTLSSGAGAERVTTVVFAGNHSLRATVPNMMGQGGGAAYITRTLGSRRSEGPLFVRAFMFLPAESETRRDWLVMLKLFAADDSSSASKISFDLIDRDALQLAVNPAKQFPGSATNAIPRNRWFCVELAVFLGAAGSPSSAVQLYIDDALQLSVPQGTATVGPLGVNAIQFGLDVAGARGTSEVFIDNVAAATERIGCQ